MSAMFFRLGRCTEGNLSAGWLRPLSWPDLYRPRRPVFSGSAPVVQIPGQVLLLVIFMPCPCVLGGGPGPESPSPRRSSLPPMMPMVGPVSEFFDGLIQPYLRAHRLGAVAKVGEPVQDIPEPVPCESLRSHERSAVLTVEQRKLQPSIIEKVEAANLDPGTVSEVLSDELLLSLFPRYRYSNLGGCLLKTYPAARRITRFKLGACLPHSSSFRGNQSHSVAICCSHKEHRTCQTTCQAIRIRSLARSTVWRSGSVPSHRHPRGATPKVPGRAKRAKAQARAGERRSVSRCRRGGSFGSRPSRGKSGTG